MREVFNQVVNVFKTDRQPQKNINSFDELANEAGDPKVANNRIGVPLISNGTPFRKRLDELIAVTANLLALLWHRLETSAVDNFAQLGFV